MNHQPQSHYIGTLQGLVWRCYREPGESGPSFRARIAKMQGAFDSAMARFRIGQLAVMAARAEIIADVSGDTAAGQAAAVGMRHLLEAHPELSQDYRPAYEHFAAVFGC